VTWFDKVLRWGLIVGVVIALLNFMGSVAGEEWTRGILFLLVAWWLMWIERQ
jgi:hypothetical protein